MGGTEEWNSLSIAWDRLRIIYDILSVLAIPRWQNVVSMANVEEAVVGAQLPPLRLTCSSAH